MLRVAIVLCLVGAALCGPPVSRTRSEIEKFRNFLESTRTGNSIKLEHLTASDYRAILHPSVDTRRESTEG